VDANPRRKKKGLTEEALNILLSHLDPDRDQAGEKYEIIRYKLVKYFEWRRMPHPDEAADETVDRVARKLQEGKNITDLLAYARGVARLVCLERLKGEAKAQESLAEMAKIQPISEPEHESDERLMQSLNKCLAMLPETQRQLIIRYYGAEEPNRMKARAEMAEGMGIPMNALRIRAHRIKQKLEDCIRKISQSGGQS
jgi:RNA polymerase sigma factor (sigma-70 family)